MPTEQQNRILSVILQNSVQTGTNKGFSQEFYKRFLQEPCKKGYK